MGRPFQPVKSPYLIRKLSSRELVWQVAVSRPVIFLTFDDGPVPDATPEVLDILGENHAKASFFCVGDNVRKHPEIYERILREGHSTGNHTYSHLNGWKTKTEEYIADVARAGEFIHGPLFRPPYGRIKREQARILGAEHDIILWSVLSWDFHPTTTAVQCLGNVLNNSRSGSIVVFHDSPRTMETLRYVLPRFLKEFREKGFTFEALSTDHTLRPLSDAKAIRT